MRSDKTGDFGRGLEDGVVCQKIRAVEEVGRGYARRIPLLNSSGYAMRENADRSRPIVAEAA